MHKVILPRKENPPGLFWSIDSLWKFEPEPGVQTEITTSHRKKTKGWIPSIISGMGDGVIKAVFLPKRIGSILMIFPVLCVSSDY